jgi:hypothetical protein
MVKIVKPHNELMVAEATIDRLHAQIGALKAALGDCAALMQADIADGRTASTVTRKYVIAKARELS